MRDVRPLLLAGVLVAPALVLAQAPAPAAPASQPAAPAKPEAAPPAPHTMPKQPEKLPAPKWNPNTVETIQGKLIGVWRSKRFGVVPGIDTEKYGVVLLDIGPSYFIDPMITFAAGDEIEARGSRVTFTNGMMGMLVSTLKRGDLMVNIRTNQGKKLW